MSRQVTISGHQFLIPAPYEAGHVLEENEAAVLNQTYAENIRNNFSSTVKKAVEAGDADLDALQGQLDEYISSYKFGVRRTGTRVVLDPVDKEANKIAGAKVLEALKKKGIAKKDLEDGKFDELVGQVLENYPQVREAAQRIVDARNAVGDMSI